MALLGVILAGGQARRMGGGDKTLSRVGGRTVLSRVVERLSPQVDRLVLNANGDAGRFAATGLTVLADSVPGCPGPLAGVLAALDIADGADVLSVPGDAPFLPGDLAVRLRGARDRAGAMVAVAASGGRRHPVVALWSPGTAAAVRAALADGRLKVGLCVASVPNVEVAWPDAPYDPFLNVNTAADLAEAERVAALAQVA